MRFKTAINEIVGIEYSSSEGAVSHDSSASNTEKYIASEIIKAFKVPHKLSDELKSTYGKNLKPDDIIVTSSGATYDVQFNPEDEVHKKKSGPISKQHLEKGIGNPQTMALILLGR